MSQIPTNQLGSAVMSALEYFEQQLSFMKHSRDSLSDGGVKDEYQHKIEVLQEVISTLRATSPKTECVPEGWALHRYSDRMSLEHMGRKYRHESFYFGAGRDGAVAAFLSELAGQGQPESALDDRCEAPQGWIITDRIDGAPCEYSKPDRSASVWSHTKTWVASVGGMCLKDAIGRAKRFGSHKSAITACEEALSRSQK